MSLDVTGKHVVVTGAAGAIGSRLVKRLLDAGCSKVYAVDDLSSGFRWLLPDAERVVFYKRDVAQPFMQGVPFGAAAVFHLAAHFGNQASCESPFLDLHTNTQGTLRALEAAAQNRAERFVYAAAGCAKDHRDTPYQISKAVGSDLCRYYADRLPTAVCHFHNSYGPGEVPGQHRNVIPRWLWAAHRGELLAIFGDGNDGRDFVFVDDLVDFLVRSAMPASTRRAAEYEVGSGTWTSVADLAQMVLEVTGSKSEIVYGADRRRWDHPGRACPKPIPTTVTLREGLEKTYAWMLENEQEIARSTR